MRTAVWRCLLSGCAVMAGSLLGSGCADQGTLFGNLTVSPDAECQPGQTSCLGSARGLGKHRAIEERARELALEFTLGPALSRRQSQVKGSLLGRFDAQGSSRTSGASFRSAA